MEVSELIMRTGKGKQALYVDRTELSELGQASKFYIPEDKNQE